MKICFTSDLHGRECLYQQLTRLLDDERPDLLILGGDLFVDGDVDDPLGTQVAYLDGVFVPRLADWRRRNAALKIACILGNHDWRCTETRLQEHAQTGLLNYLSFARPWVIDGFAFLGFSNTPPTPYWVKDFERLDMPGDPTPEIAGVVWNSAQRRSEQIQPAQYFCEQSTLADELGRLKPMSSPWIFVCHAPPHDSTLDRLPHVPHPVGSRAVRSFIERHQPACALHGHIHESPDVTGAISQRIGQTLCVNPGQSVERLQAVTLDTRDPGGTLRHIRASAPAAVA